MLVNESKEKNVCIYPSMLSIYVSMYLCMIFDESQRREFSSAFAIR